MRAWVTAKARKRLMEPGNETPLGINLATGAVVISAGAFAAALLPAADLRVRFAVATVLLAGIGAFTADWLATGALVLIAGMLMNGFLVNRLGTLSWHGSADAYRLLALAGGALAGLVAGELVRAVAEVKERDRLGVLVHQMATEFNEETRRA